MAIAGATASALSCTPCSQTGQARLPSRCIDELPQAIATRGRSRQPSPQAWCPLCTVLLQHHLCSNSMHSHSVTALCSTSAGAAESPGRAVPRACRGCRIHFHADHEAKGVPRPQVIWMLPLKCLTRMLLHLVSWMLLQSMGCPSQRWDDAGWSGTPASAAGTLDSGCATLVGGSPERVSGAVVFRCSSTPVAPTGIGTVVCASPPTA